MFYHAGSQNAGAGKRLAFHRKRSLAGYEKNIPPGSLIFSIFQFQFNTPVTSEYAWISQEIILLGAKIIAFLRQEVANFNGNSFKVWQIPLTSLPELISFEL